MRKSPEVSSRSSAGRLCSSARTRSGFTGGISSACLVGSVAAGRGARSRRGRSSQRRRTNSEASASSACWASCVGVTGLAARRRMTLPFWARNSRSSSVVRRRGCSSPAVWKRLELRPAMCRGSTVALVRRARRTKLSDQRGSSTRRRQGRRLETSPAGNIRIAPPRFRWSSTRRVPVRFDRPSGSTSMSQGRMPGICASHSLPTTSVSGRARSRNSIATSPSVIPCGWFATASSAPVRGMRARHSSAQLGLRSACSSADAKKSGRPA